MIHPCQSIKATLHIARLAGGCTVEGHQTIVDAMPNAQRRDQCEKRDNAPLRPPWLDEDFRVPVGICQLGEGASDFTDANLAGHHGRYIHGATRNQL